MLSKTSLPLRSYKMRLTASFLPGLRLEKLQLGISNSQHWDAWRVASRRKLMVALLSTTPPPTAAIISGAAADTAIVTSTAASVVGQTE
jgi:hypothetical protein